MSSDASTPSPADSTSGEISLPVDPVSRSVITGIESFSQPTLVAEVSGWAGPLPPPEALARFKAIDPELPRIIVRMAQTEQKMAAKRLQAQILDLQQRRAIERRGQNFAVILALTFLATGVGMTVAGYPAFGITVTGFTLAAVVTAMLGSRALARRSDSTPAPESDEH